MPRLPDRRTDGQWQCERPRIPQSDLDAIAMGLNSERISNAVSASQARPKRLWIASGHSREASEHFGVTAKTFLSANERSMVQLAQMAGY